MIGPVSGYSPGITPTAPQRSPDPRSALADAAPGLSPRSGDPGLVQQRNPASAGNGLSRPNLALLEAMQAGRETSALLSSLSAPVGSLFTAAFRPALTPPGQSIPQPQRRALFEAMQAGRENAALFSSLMGPAPGARSDGFSAVVRGQGSSNVANPRADLARAEEILSATQTGQPSIAASRIAQEAYLMEIQAQSQIQQGSIGSSWLHEWFA